MDHGDALSPALTELCLYVVGSDLISHSLFYLFSGHVEGFKSPISPADSFNSAIKMFSKVRRQGRPLGYFYPESRIELQLEKEIFRQNAQVLRDMCDIKLKQRRREAHQYLPIDQFSRNLKFEKSTVQHNQEQRLQFESINHASTIAPEVRWLLTRSARLQRANNAGFSKYNKPVKDCVVSANGKRDTNAMSLERQRSMCSRNEEYDRSIMQKCQCDILGPPFCSDCTKIKQKVTQKHEQDQQFPRIEVHTRSLVAPERVERLYLSHPEELFHQRKKYACGYAVSPEFEITTPLVYTPHEIFERIRRKKYIELGNELIRKEKEMKVQQRQKNTPVEWQHQHRQHQQQEQIDQKQLSQPSFYEEKTETPLDMKISVVIRNDRPG